ncbi:MAG: ATP-binding protein [Planctomycetota bacterium]
MRAAALLLVLLAGVVAAGYGHARTLHADREQRAADAMRARFEGYEEHVRYVARLEPDAIARYLTDFKGLARVRMFDADGAVQARIERLRYFVAIQERDRPDAPPRAPEGIAGLESDASRLDVRDDLRSVVRYTAARPEGGWVELTVYAAPFLPGGAARLRTTAGQPLLDSGVGLASEEWRVVLPFAPSFADVQPYVLLAFGVVVLGAIALLFRARQRRALERMAMERELAQGERLRALGLLASGIAHEINNPLEGIANWMAIGETGRAREGLDRIAALTRQLLRFARGQEQAHDAAPADVAETFRNAHALAAVSDVCRHVRTEEALPDGLCVRVPGAVLEQVFLNLLLNAGAAMRACEDKRVRVEARSNDSSVIVEVRDSGPGIAPDDRARVFDPFFSRSGGSGLGLSVSYGLVEASGGSLTVAEQVAGDGGEGACFKLELPRA